MNTFQKTIKYIGMAFAIFLAVSIIGGILNVVGLFVGFYDNDMVNKDMKTYTVSSDIFNLKLNINAADFTIKQGKKFSVESNLKNLSVDDKSGTLTINETKKYGRVYTGAKLILYIPADTNFETATITTGAGRLTADYLSADTIEFEFGAGEVKIDTLIANSEAHIEGGAGMMTISDGDLCNLDLEMGIGKLNLTSALTGNSDFDMGVGESDITVTGNKDDYKLDIEKGLGKITVDGVSTSSVKNMGQGSNSISISGGIGAVNVKFSEVNAE